jgi:hypothetical protein
LLLLLVVVVVVMLLLLLLLLLLFSWAPKWYGSFISVVTLQTYRQIICDKIQSIKYSMIIMHILNIQGYS